MDSNFLIHGLFWSRCDPCWNSQPSSTFDWAVEWFLMRWYLTFEEVNPHLQDAHLFVERLGCLPGSSLHSFCCWSSSNLFLIIQGCFLIRVDSWCAVAIGVGDLPWERQRSYYHCNELNHMGLRSSHLPFLLCKPPTNWQGSFCDYR